MNLELTTIEKLTAHLAENGFAPEINDLHRRIIEPRVCPRKNRNCRNTNLIYYGFTDCKSYLCFSYCPSCGQIEFFKHLSDIFTPVEGLLIGEVYLRSAA